MKRKILSIVFAVVLALFLCLVMAVPASANETTYYVATTGDNGNDGSSGSPWLTIQHAVDNVITGDTIIVTAGMYVEDVDVDVATGITIQGESLDAIVDGGFLITVDGITIDGLTIENGRAGSLSEESPCAIVIEGESDGHSIINNVLIGAEGLNEGNGILLSKLNDDVLIDGNETINWRWGIHLRSLQSNVTISNNEVYDAFNAGIGLGNSTDCVVTYNDIHDNNVSGDTTGGAGGISVWSGSGHEINYNKIYDNFHSGLSHYNTTNLDATYNWWGSTTGPEASDNPDGLGNSVICDGGDVASYRPWLNGIPTADYADKTIKGNKTVTLHGSLTYYWTISDAITDAVAGNLITVEAGTYAENLVVDKALTLESVAGADATTIDASATAVSEQRGAIQIAATVSDVTVGGAGTGFTIIAPDEGLQYGVEIGLNCDRVTIQENTIEGDVQVGVHIWGAGDDAHEDIVIMDNTITTDETAPAGECYGIITAPIGQALTLFGNASLIDGNDISGFSGTAIYLDGVDGASTSLPIVISDNTLYDNTLHGLVVVGREVSVTGNTIYSNTLNGLTIAEDVETTNISVEENNVYSNTEYGIRLYPNVDATTITVENNNIYSNTAGGLSNGGTGICPAESNWWGAANGPSGLPYGSGDGNAVSANVDYIPWLGAIYPGGLPVYPAYIGTTGYDTIQEAVTAALSGETITVTPGTYVGDITISENLTLVSTGGYEVTKLTGTDVGNPVVTIGDYTVTLDDFTIDITGGDGVNISDISAGKVVTIENAVIHNNDTGIYVNGTVYGTLNILNNLIAENVNYGVYIYAVDEGGIVNVRGNVIGAWEDDTYDFDGNTSTGLYIDGIYDESTVTIGGATEAEYNLICDNGSEGIYVDEVYYNSTLTIAGNAIGAWAYDDYIFDGNSSEGIYVYNVNYGSTLTIRDNAISENGDEGSDGIYIYQVGYDGTTETEAEYYALFATYGTNTVTIESNMIGDWEYDSYSFGGNSGEGIYIYYANFASELTIRGNTISGNGGDGIALEYFGDEGDGFYLNATTSDLYVNPAYPNYFGPVVLIQNNDITDNEDYGIYQGGDWEYGTSVTIENNFISGNWYAGFYGSYVQYDATLTIRGNTITSNGIDGGEGGIYYADAEYAGSITIEGNLIAGNFGEGIYSSYVYDKSSLTIRGNTIGAGTDAEGNVYAGNTYQGIYLSDVSEYSTAEISRNTISGNEYDGIYIDDVCAYGSVDITRNDILENRKKGINVYSVYGEGSVDIHYNNLVGNDWSGTDMGVKYDYGTFADEMVDASYNWWGDVSGPGRQGPGTGDGVSDYVVFSPWLSSLAFWDVRVELVEGWNTFSTPITLDSTSNELAELGLDRDMAYGFYGGIWVLITADNDGLVPCDAFYIKMNSSASFSLVPSEGYSSPPSRALDEDWNLVSLANLSDMAAEEALASAYLVSGDLSGYSQAVSPAVNETAWSAVRGPAIDTVLGYDMIPTEGYWVFMTNAGTLAGFTSTPIVEVSP